MIRVSFLYPNTEGSTFDRDYYLNVHAEVSKKVFESVLLDIRLDIGVAGIEPGSAPPLHAAGHLTFNSVDDFYAALMPNLEMLRTDAMNYTSVEPTIVISEAAVG